MMILSILSTGHLVTVLIETDYRLINGLYVIHSQDEFHANQMTMSVGLLAFHDSHSDLRVNRHGIHCIQALEDPACLEHVTTGHVIVVLLCRISETDQDKCFPPYWPLIYYNWVEVVIPRLILG